MAPTMIYPLPICCHGSHHDLPSLSAAMAPTMILLLPDHACTVAHLSVPCMENAPLASVVWPSQPPSWTKQSEGLTEEYWDL